MDWFIQSAKETVRVYVLNSENWGAEFQQIKAVSKRHLLNPHQFIHQLLYLVATHRHLSNHLRTPQLVGTHLEYIDDDDYVNVNESPVGDHSNTTQDQPPIETRRYSTQQHWPPARLQDYTTCLRWDIFSVEGDSVTKRQSLSIIYFYVVNTFKISCSHL